MSFQKSESITKGDLAQYYDAVAPFLPLAHAARHLLSIVRCSFRHRRKLLLDNVTQGKGSGPDVHPFPFESKGKKFEYLYIDDERGLLELVQMGAIEIHPWGAAVDSIDKPDRMIFDLDPAPDVPFDTVKLAAQDLRQRLRKHKLESTLKVTGGKGLHIIVPLDAQDPWDAVKGFASSLAHEMAEDAPDAYVATMNKAKRVGKIFIDYLRNEPTATSIADYSVRARPGAPVAVPVDWSELKQLKSADEFRIKDVLRRLEKKVAKKPPKSAKLRQPLALNSGLCLSSSESSLPACRASCSARDRHRLLAPRDLFPAAQTSASLFMLFHHLVDFSFARA